MGTLLAFSLTSSLVLTALYLPYKWLMAGEKTFSFNRLAIIACYMVSLAAFFVMPLFHFDNARDAVANISIGELNIDVVNEDPEQSTFGLVSILLCVYLVGVICTSGFVVWNLVCIQRILMRTEKSEICGACVNITRDTWLVPFSFGRKIVIPQSAIDSSVGLIVAHEKVHIARHHWLDLLLAQAVCVIQWYNPAAWLMMRELRAVHEFQADEGAIRQGVDIKEYQILLIKKAVGVRFPSLTNSLNHSNLKTRITMMYSNKPNGLRKLRSIALVPALGAALLVINLPAVASGLSAVTATDLPSLSDDKVKENPEPRQIHVVKHTEKSDSKEATVVAYSATAKGSVVTSGNGKGTNVSTSIDPVDGDVDVAPQYPGGEAAMLKKLLSVLQYPKSSKDADEQGRVLVKFIVDKNGKVVSPEIEKGVSPALDQAAIEAVKQLDDFIPAQKNGKPVSVYYYLPVKFALQDDAKATNPTKLEMNLPEKVTKIFLNGNEVKHFEKSDIDYSNDVLVYRTNDGNTSIIIKQPKEQSHNDSIN